LSLDSTPNVWPTVCTSISIDATRNRSFGVISENILKANKLQIPQPAL
jgi:hypothetical protein